MTVPTLPKKRDVSRSNSTKAVVLLSDTAYVDGGASKVAIASAAGIAARGIDVTLLAASGPIAPELRETVHVRCTEQAKIAEAPNRIGAALQGLWNGATAKALREILVGRERSTTIVHVHSWSKALSPSVLNILAREGFSTIVTLHDFFSACPNGSFYDHSEERICTRRAMSASCIRSNCDSRNYPTKLYRVARQIALHRFSRFPQSVRHFISMSDLSRRVLEPYLPTTARIHHVHNPVDAVWGPPADVAANERFVYVGRLSPEKGVTMLAEAARRIGVPLTFVGDGEERSGIARINPEARITGWLPADAVRAELRGARALILPSLWYEVMPLVVTEAASLGIPAAVPDTCGASEEVEHETTGLVFRGGSIDALAESMLRLRDARFAASLGEAAYARYWANPNTIEAHVDEVLRIYDLVLAEESRR